MIKKLYVLAAMEFNRHHQSRKGAIKRKDTGPLVGLNGWRIMLFTCNIFPLRRTMSTSSLLTAGLWIIHGVALLHITFIFSPKDTFIAGLWIRLF